MAIIFVDDFFGVEPKEIREVLALERVLGELLPNNFGLLKRLLALTLVEPDCDI
jgi:hypothetical protein